MQLSRALRCTRHFSSLKDKTLLKVMMHDEVHRKFQYKPGVNVCNNTFEPYDPSKEDRTCLPGGLYFADKENIRRFFYIGPWLRKVTLPVDDPDLKVAYIPPDKYRANKIILGEERYSLFDPKTYELFGLKIQENYSLFCVASEMGSIENLEHGLNLYSNKKIPDRDSRVPISYAIRCGHVHVLDWWRDTCIKHNLPFDCDDDLFKYGIANNEKEVNEWWQKHRNESFVKKQ